MTGVAWLSSARVVRCWVKSRNERNPCLQLPSLSWGLWRDCRCKSEEGGDDVKSACPLCPGRHTCYNGRYREKRDREVEQNSKTGPSSDCRLQLACMKSELLVIANQNVAVNAFPGLVHTARHTMEVGGAQSWTINSLPKAKPMTGVKS